MVFGLDNQTGGGCIYGALGTVWGDRLRLCYFPLAAVANHHKPVGYNTDLFSYSSGAQKSERSFSGRKLRCRQGWFFLEAQGRRHSLARGLFLHL